MSQIPTRMFHGPTRSGFLSRLGLLRIQKAFRYVILLPEIPDCNASNNELLRFVESGEAPTFSRQISFHDAVEGTAKLALEFEHHFAEHCTRLNDVHFPKTFSTVLEPLCKEQARLSYAWSTLRHLFTVTNFKSPEHSLNAEIELQNIKKVVSRCLSSQYNNEAFYRSLKELYADQKFLNFWQIRLCTRYLVEGRLNGVEISSYNRRTLSQARAKLEHDIENFKLNIEQSSIQRCNKISDLKFLQDAPASMLYEWSLNPNDYLQGPYLITLSHSGYNNFMKYCRDRLTRYKYFVFWNSRASFKEKSPYTNNSILVDDIRLGREDEAKALGFKSYAEMSLQTKMARSLDEVEDFLAQLRGKCKEKFNNRLNDMQLYAKKNEMVGDPLKPWDYSYFARKLIETATEFSPADFSSCFPFFRTWRNLLSLTEKMFNITYVDVSDTTERWHDTVKVLSVRDASTGQERGLIYVDAFIRPNKLRSSWISHGRGSCQYNGYKPIIYLTLNIMASEKLEAVPMSLNLLLFIARSLGDALATILTNSPYSTLSGSQPIELDGERLYAEFFKWLVLEPSILNRLSSNRLSLQDADIVREVYIESMLPTILREGFLSELDMVINHSSGKIFWRDIYKDLYLRYYDKPVDKNDSYPCSFVQIMANQSPAAYYGSLWSEMLACDALAAFKETDCFQNDTALTALGQKFRENFLSLGGGLNTRDIFRKFRSRDLEYKHLFDFYKLDS